MTHRRNIFKTSMMLAFLVLILGGNPGATADAAPLGSPPAHQLYIVKDINPGDGNPGSITPFAGGVIFRANDGDAGDELWISDGTPEGTNLLKDITDGPNPSYPTITFEYQNKLFFSATQDLGATYQMWVTDGTSAGTTFFKNIRPSGCSGPHTNAAILNSEVYFGANDGVNGYELWKSDGTPDNTTMVANIGPAAANGFANCFATLNNKVYFRADDGSIGSELWQTNGTTVGTTLLKDIYSGDSNSSSYVWGPVVYDGNIYFSAEEPTYGRELYKSDGTAENTTRITDINLDGLDSNPLDMTIFNNMIFYAATDSDYGGRELWYTNPVTDVSNRLIDINPDAGGAFPAFHNKYLAVLGDMLYFSANNGSIGPELWATDGTALGTHIVADIFPLASGSEPHDLTSVNGKLFFAANDATYGVELWVYAPGRIFADGFESGNLTAWSSSKGADLQIEAVCKLCLTTKGPLHGDTSLKVRVPNKKPHYLQDNDPNFETRYSARFLIKLGKTLKMNNLNKFKLFMGKNGKQTPFFLQVRKKGTKFQIRAAARVDSGKTLKTKWTAMPKKAITVEVDWKAAESTIKHNGYVKLYINGKLKKKKGGLNNDKQKVDLVRLGVTARIKSAFNISGSFKLDHFESDDTFYIGP